MIRNEKQYRTTRAQARRFESALKELAESERPGRISAKLWRAQREAAESQLADLRAELAEYERLLAGRERAVVLQAVEELPTALIRARIAAGLTQEGLAERLGLKAQQIQRYEATHYESASFSRIRAVVSALGLRLLKPAVLERGR